MKRVLIVIGLLCIAIPAFALSDALLDYCLTTKDPKACIQDVLAHQERHQLELQRDAAQAQYAPQQNLVPLGAAPAFINGFNQNFQNMQLPYACTPQFGCPQSPR